MQQIKVLIVDDSPFVRVFLTKILSKDKNIQVVGTAANPNQAVREIKEKRPDLLTLDVEMPVMNGLEFLKRLMIAHPMPVIMISTLTAQGSKATLEALKIGAVDFITKPNLIDQEKIIEFKNEVLNKIKAVKYLKMNSLIKIISHNNHTYQKEKCFEKYRKYNQKVITGIGVSTGGVQTLKVLLPSFPPDLPGMVVIQHMPEGFTAPFARELDRISSIRVKEAEAGDKIIPGQALLVPGNYHLEIIRKRKQYYVELNKSPKVNYQRPSIDITFKSMVEAAGRNAIGVLLTGMGRDGAQGMVNIKEAGGYTIAQNEETAIIYGMPKAAVKLNAVDEVLPLMKISQRIIKKISEVK